MRIIGNIIKRTNKVAYLNYLRKSQRIKSQLDELTGLLKTAYQTNFGTHHQFNSMLSSADVVAAYQQKVPITDYEEFYETWLKASMNGTKNHTWPGLISHYALSSGTTGASSKRIPVTSQMIRSFQKSSLNQLALLHELNLSEAFYGGKLLAVGGSSNLVKKDFHIEGDLSGILKKYTPIIVSPFTFPSGIITRERNWHVKLEMMVKKAPEWNISIIAGVPSWCILLMEEIVAQHNVKNIHEIWPNLKVYVHGGVFIQPYISRLEKLLGHKIHLLDTYLASEGYFAYQKSPSNTTMQLLLNAGVFYEFIPFNSDYFNEDGTLKNKHKALRLEEVEPLVDYALVVSTNAGLWRYLIGDLVQFKNVEAREIILTGRIKQYLSLCGEHLSLDNIIQALEFVANKHEAEFSEFTIYADEETRTHHWFLGTNSNADKETIMREIDQQLMVLNDDYKCARDINLKQPVLTFLPVEKFYAFLASKGKLGAQNKFPRVLNKEQRVEWIYFLKNIESAVI